MPTSKATSEAGSGAGKVNTSTSGPNAKASATSADNQGSEWISKSKSTTDKDGNTIIERVLGKKGEGEDSGWTLLGLKNKGEGESGSAKADATTGGKEGAKATSGKASAGIVDGKAVATAG